MTPSETMAHRVAFVQQLIDTDQSLTHLFAQKTSNRLLEECRSLLRVRRSIVDELRFVGYHAWPIMIDEREAKVS